MSVAEELVYLLDEASRGRASRRRGGRSTTSQLNLELIKGVSWTGSGTRRSRSCSSRRRARVASRSAFRADLRADSAHPRHGADSVVWRPRDREV